MPEPRSPEPNTEAASAPAGPSILPDHSPRIWLALLGLAMVLPRLIWLGDARWTGEESWFFNEIVLTAQGMRWSGVGTPVSGTEGFHPGPYFYWLLAPFALTSSPKLVALGVALLDAAAQLIALAALNRFWAERPVPQRRMALIAAAALLAISPWALLYADRPWNSNLVSLPVAAALWGYAHWSRSGKLGPFLALTAGLGTLPSFHLSAPLLGVPLLIMVARRWRLLNGRTVLAAALLSAAIWTPYTLSELRSGGANTRGLMKRTLPPVRGFDNAALAISWPLRMTSPAIGYHAQRGYWTPYEPAAFARPKSRQGKRWWTIHGDLALPGTLIGLLLAIGAWLLWLRGLRRHSDPMTVILTAGTLLGWALLIVAGRRAYPHYLQPLLPLYVGAVALGIAQVPKRFRRATLVLLGIHLATGLLVTQRFYHHNDRPYGLDANILSAELIEGLGRTRPVFCGALGYRHRGQLHQISRHSHPRAVLDSRERVLVHALSHQIPPQVSDHSVWRREAHGLSHLLLVEALPLDWRKLGCH